MTGKACPSAWDSYRDGITLTCRGTALKPSHYQEHPRKGRRASASILTSRLSAASRCKPRPLDGM